MTREFYGFGTDYDWMPHKNEINRILGDVSGRQKDFPINGRIINNQNKYEPEININGVNVRGRLVRTPSSRRYNGIYVEYEEPKPEAVQEIREIILSNGILKRIEAGHT